MNIAEILKTRIKNEHRGFAVPVIEEQILIDGSLGNKDRVRSVFHPSEICRGDFCPRSWILGHRDPSMYKNKKINLLQQKRFDCGSDFHKYMQKKAGNSGILFGAWECIFNCEGTNCLHVGFSPSNTCVPGKKDKSFWRYKEPILSDPIYNIGGQTDGIAKIADRKYLLEFKSMNTDSFRTLIEPLPNDIEQSLWYIDILERCGFEQFNAVKDYLEDQDVQFMKLPYEGSLIIYGDKNDHTYKEYFIPSKGLARVKNSLDSKDDVFLRIESKKEMLLNTLKHRDDGTLPERLYQCDDKSSTRAKQCFASKPCFN